MKHLSIAEIVELSVPERIRLVQSVWDSIAQVPESVPVTDKERKELDRRLEAYLRDPKAGTPWAKVVRRLKAAR